MSVQDEITRIATAKADIASALEEKGVSVAEGTSLDEMGDMVRSISSGGEANIIESVSVNSIPLPITNKNVNIDLSGYVNLNESTTISKESLSIDFANPQITSSSNLHLKGVTAHLVGTNSYVVCTGGGTVEIGADNGITFNNAASFLSDVDIEGTFTISGKLAATQAYADTVAANTLTSAKSYTDKITNGWQKISYTTSNMYATGAKSATISLTDLNVKANPLLKLISVSGRVTVNTTSSWTTTPGFYFNTTPLKNVIGSMPSTTFVFPITCTLNGTLETEMAYIQLTSSQFRVLQYETLANHRTSGKRIYYLNAMIPY